MEFKKFVSLTILIISLSFTIFVINMNTIPDNQFHKTSSLLNYDTTQNEIEEFTNKTSKQDLSKELEERSYSIKEIDDIVFQNTIIQEQVNIVEEKFRKLIYIISIILIILALIICSASIFLIIKSEIKNP